MKGKKEIQEKMADRGTVSSIACRVYSKENKREKTRGALHTPSMIYKIVGQASRLSRIDSRFRGNDKE